MMETSEKPKKVKTLEASPVPDWPVSMGIDKDRAANIKVGDKLKVVISGEVTSISSADFGAEKSAKLRVEIRSPKILEVESNSADMELKRITEKK